MGTAKPLTDNADFVTALLSGPLLRALDRYIVEEAPGRNRSDALRIAFKEWCVDRGYITLSESDPDLS